eukprot:5276502-Prymnesium_polylepis.1
MACSAPRKSISVGSVSCEAHGALDIPPLHVCGQLRPLGVPLACLESALCCGGPVDYALIAALLSSMMQGASFLPLPCSLLLICFQHCPSGRTLNKSVHAHLQSAPSASQSAACAVRGKALASGVARQLVRTLHGCTVARLHGCDHPPSLRTHSDCARCGGPRWLGQVDQGAEGAAAAAAVAAAPLPAAAGRPQL